MKHRQMDRHHLYPKSQFGRLAGASWNIRVMNRDRHRAWHFLVGNASPLEAILILLDEFLPENLRYDPYYEDFKERVRKL